ncbi:MAG: tyrosine-type recombinase/integrase [Firmicutes bacterium]|nr:tyrosine-type recombinase/integrase [Bacillota bacterium]
MTYFDERNKTMLDRLQVVLEDLPRFCIEFFIGVQNRTSPLTRLNYAYDLRIFFVFLAERIFKKNLSGISLSDLQSLTAFDIELFLDHLNNYTLDGKSSHCGEKAKERKLATIRSFLKYYYNKDKLTSNVATKVEAPKPHTKNIVRLDVHEVSKLLNTIEHGSTSLTKMQAAYHTITRLRDLALVTLFLGTGIRISELIGIDNDDMDFENLSFVVTRKGGNKTILYFSEEVCKALQDYVDWKKQQMQDGTNLGLCLQQNKAFFVSLQGNRISQKAVQNLVAKFCKLASPLKKISPHKLRSTFGTHLYQTTGDIYVVAEVLGHKDVNTTKKHYAQSSEQIKRNASTALVLREPKD